MITGEKKRQWVLKKEQGQELLRHTFILRESVKEKIGDLRAKSRERNKKWDKTEKWRPEA